MTRPVMSRIACRGSLLFLAALCFTLASAAEISGTPSEWCPRNSSVAQVLAEEQGGELVLRSQGDEPLEVRVAKSGGLYRTPLRVRLGDSGDTIGMMSPESRSLAIEGFYVTLNNITDGFRVGATESVLEDGRIVVKQTLSHADLPAPAALTFTLWLEPRIPMLHVSVEVNFGNFGNSGDTIPMVSPELPKLHLDRLGIGKHAGTDLRAKRMFFGRMYVLDEPEAFEVEHNYNTCRFWCWTMANGVTELQATGGPARGFRYDPAEGVYDLYTYCESPIDYQFVFTARGPQAAIAAYRGTIDVPAPATLAQLPGRVGVMTSYPIAERYEDFLEEFTGRGARDFVWLSYCPTPGDRERVVPYGALYATYDTYLDSFREGVRKTEGWSPEMVRYRHTGKMVRGYWSSTWLLPELYVAAATTRVMGVFGREFRNDEGENDFIATPATRYSNLAITRAEVGPNALYLDVHASKAPLHFFDWQGRHHGAWEHMRGEKALFDFAREYLGGAPIWSEGGGEDYVGLMDGGWFMDWRSPEELGIHAAKWQYYPFIDEVHRERLLNMSIYYPLASYDTEMVNAAILFGRPQAISVYSGTSQEDVAGRLQVYYMTKAFHQMLGLSRMDRVDFQDDDIDRPIVSYANGAQAWVNRSAEVWTVDEYALPPGGYLVRGPGGFLEHRSLRDGEIIDVVRSAEYDYFSCDKRTDFGPIVMDGALAIARISGISAISGTSFPWCPRNRGNSNLLTVYEIRKPHGAVELRLGNFGDTIGMVSPKFPKAEKAWAVLTRNRRLELTFPDFREFRGHHSDGVPEIGPVVQFSPVEMRETVRYEISLSP